MNGVVHVGAHKGEEVPLYESQGRSPIILFEPQWNGFALGNRTGLMPFTVPRHLDGTPDTQSATGYPLIESRAIDNGWTPTPCDITFVPVIRFDEWALLTRFRGGCTLLVIDVQGMELEVLQGFGVYLDDFDELKIECSSPPLYLGGADASEVVQYLGYKGFIPTSPIVRHGDITFRRSE